jgi:hypothetical protein
LLGGDVDSMAIGAVIELQIYSIEGNLAKSEAIQAFHGLLEDLLIVYDGTEFPIRRSRYVGR